MTVSCSLTGMLIEKGKGRSGWLLHVQSALAHTPHCTQTQSRTEGCGPAAIMCHACRQLRAFGGCNLACLLQQQEQEQQQQQQQEYRSHGVLPWCGSVSGSGCVATLGRHLQKFQKERRSLVPKSSRLGAGGERVSARPSSVHRRPHLPQAFFQPDAATPCRLFAPQNCTQMEGGALLPSGAHSGQTYCVTALGPVPRSAIGCIAAREVRARAAAIAFLHGCFICVLLYSTFLIFPCLLLQMLLFDWAALFDARSGATGTAYDVANTHALRRLPHPNIPLLVFVDTSAEKILSHAGVRYP
jgi:hypothetical protein